MQTYLSLDVKSDMFKGIVLALSACFVWGLIFIVPQYLEGFTSIEVALGRNLFYGVISLLIFAKAWAQGGCRYDLTTWGYALLLSSTAIIYYTCVVLSVRYAHPASCALILGTRPIAIAFYGNWKQRECRFQTLVLPSLLIFMGLMVTNVPHFTQSESPAEYVLGLVCALLALSSWTWYCVANARFLKRHPSVVSTEWATLMGVAMIFWVTLGSLFLGFFFAEELQIQKYSVTEDSLIRFLCGCAILGVICSWLGSTLWNMASFHLPVSLAGQLTIFETVFGLCFVYALSEEMPPWSEWVGVALMLGAVIYGIRLFARSNPQRIEA